ncbi:hypothetical protein [Roseibium polysiphoniae]|uniref:Tail tape measure protein n=1 Tax=Roseibium polysiphoniae TaxID=2571221 RepID=A0ABR9C964_9HYPH|nr:hypothetical protein [Roseibium polysiphoniae]MBD8875436.1 hypothetical protein [Roseibium polysiphoniae]
MTVPALVWAVRAKDESPHVFKKQRREMAQTGQAAKQLNTELKSAGRAFGSFKAFGAGLGVGVLSAELIQLPSIVRGVVSEASTLAKTADLIGVTTSELQQMQFGFELAGVEASKTEESLKQFGKRLSEAESKGGMLADILAANGVALRDNQGRMRSVMALLRDYAGLIQRAASEQEKMSLANEAFGRSGTAMVLALRDGERGVQKLMGTVREAGGVLDEELLRRAEEIDDEWAIFWRNFELRGKSAILSVAAGFDALMADSDQVLSLKDVQGDLVARRKTLVREIGFSETLNETGRAAELKSQLNALDARIVAVQQERKLKASGLTYGPSGRGGPRGSKVTEPATVIPPVTTGNGGGISSSQRASDFEQVLDQLRRESELIGLNALEQRKLTLLRRAGVDAASEQGQAIAALVDQMDRESQAQRQLNEVTSMLGGIADSEIGRLLDMLGLADTAAGRLVATLSEAALKAVLLGQGPLAGALGTSGGGFLQTIIGGASSGFGGGFGGGSSIAGAFAGMYAGGGTLGAGQWGIAGEGGLPEPVVGPARIISNKDAFGGGGTVNNVRVTIQAQDVESFRRSETQIAGRILDAVKRGERGR